VKQRKEQREKRKVKVIPQDRNGFNIKAWIPAFMPFRVSAGMTPEETFKPSFQLPLE